MKRLGLLVATALVVVSCSASDDAANEAASTQPVETTATTEDTTTTTEDTTTTTEDTTTTTAAPDLEADVEAAYLRSYEVWTTCYLDLPNCDVETEFAKVYTDGSYDRLTEAALQRQADGLDYEPPDDPAHARTEIFDVSVSTSGDQAKVTFCTYSGGKEFLISDDGSRNPVGLNDTVTVGWGDANFTLGADGTWRIYDYTGGGSETVLATEIDRLRNEGKICDDPAT